MQNGEKLKQLRMMKGYSQKGIAKKLGLTQQAYSKIESDHIKIGDARMKEILIILHCTQDHLNGVEKFFFSLHAD